MNVKAWIAKHPKTVIAASMLLAVGYTPSAAAATVHTHAVQLTCTVHSTGSWCAPATAPAAAASAAPARS